MTTRLIALTACLLPACLRPDARSTAGWLSVLWRPALWLPALLALCGAGVQAASSVVTTEQVRAELLAHAPEGVAPGRPLWLGLKIEHRPHWHTYWKNPGDSGQATSMAWALPAGWVAGDIAWPTPRRLPYGPLVNLGYEGTLLLPVPVTVPSTAEGGAVELSLEADWLVCKEVCIPETGRFALRLPMGPPQRAQAALFEAALAAVPPVLPGASAVATVRDGTLALQVTGLPDAWQGRPLAFLPELQGVIDHAAPLAAAWQGERWQARVPLSAQRSQGPSAMAAVLVADGDPVGRQVRVLIDGPWPAPGATAFAPSAAPEVPAAPAATPATRPTTAGPMVWLLAFAGGLLLNLMPCVFPVLSLKVLGFATHAQERRLLLAGGLAYTAGVVASFLALAGLLIALRAGGEQLGWGFQLQSPGVVAALAVLFTVIGLNLAGLFEFGAVLPGSLASWRARHPLVDSAFTGVLAVAVASPCTAPFMGASLGVAATLPAVQALAVFAALGLGMAAPFLACSAWPSLARALPRPGAWMLHFRALMAFPMFATVVWLLWVLGQQVGVDGMVSVLGLLLAMTFVAWANGTIGLSVWSHGTLRVLTVAMFVATLAWALPALQPETGRRARADDGALQAAAAHAADDAAAGWQAWSARRVQDALAQGRPVFVDFTAAWCVTCQVNKRTVLADAQVLADFQAGRVLLLRADWTRRDAAIAAELARLGRNGVPVYALHAPGSTSPRLLSEIPSVREIREALASLR
ncbi:protein-disulfide reductase DsbD [Ideonella sp. A 288]|uniref:protein-disulfide reductase DsbD family protein n=1 Tax=Ideonella sp. A 288 TaxID=1962181 RepID=UPI0018FE477D|nr:thioredoxin family protein [Ideonella sp. A 288]